MAVKLELYRVFKEVAETGNISAAAKNLYISQSAVSQSIKQLETALQARLFARSPRGVTLTGEGQMLYQYVRNALGLLATGEDKLSQAQQLLLGTLTIGASDTVTGQFLTPYLDEFHHQHPGIRLKIVSGRSAKVVSMLRSGGGGHRLCLLSQGQHAGDLALLYHPFRVRGGEELPLRFRQDLHPAGDGGISPDPAGAEGQLPCFSGTGLGHIQRAFVIHVASPSFI